MCTKKNRILEKFDLEMTYCDLEWQLSEKPTTYLESAPLNYVNLMYHTYIEKVHYIGCPKIFAWPTGWPWKKATDGWF